MDERIDLKKSGKLKDNITRFRQDKRLAVTGALSSLALLGMLAIVVFCIFRFHEDLSPENLKRLVSYVKAANTVADPFAEYRFEAGLDTVYAPFGSGLAVSSGDTYSFVSGLGNNGYSVQLSYHDPAICTSDPYVLLYDKGNKGFCVASSYSEYLHSSLDSPILSASMNRKGAFALVTNEENYRSAVTVYSAKQKLLCKWMTSQYYVMLTSVSPDSRHFAALCFSQEELTLSTQIRYFDVDREDAVWTVDLGEKQVYSMTHDKSGGLLILCDDGLYHYDKAGNLTASQLFSASPVRFAVHEEDDIVMAFSDADKAAQRILILVASAEGELLYQESFPGSLRALDCSAGIASVLTNDALRSVRYFEEGQPVLVQQQSGARDVICDREGSAILVYSDRAERIHFEQESEN